MIDRVIQPHVDVEQEVKSKTVGILGFGTIGRGVALRAAGLQMRVCAVDAYPPQQVPPYMAWLGDDTQLPRLLSESDFLVIAVPLLPQTKGMIGVKELSLMKPSAVVINVARGPILDEAKEDGCVKHSRCPSSRRCKADA